jgi:CRISPR/Cas system CSM-associated protein Csm3 (group 7 of RAMP superfamily)
MTDNGTTGKIVLRGRLKTLSPLHIGCGSDDRSDMDILLDHEGRPFIPATAFVGVLRHAITLDNADEAAHRDDLSRFWGFAKGDKGQQSSFLCSDLTCITRKPRITIRDGIRIDNKTGIVKPQGKFDYEVLERGAVFDLNMEFCLKEKTEGFTRRMVATLYAMLQNNRIRVGAKTNSGLGEVALMEAESRIYTFDFSNDLSKKRDVYSWLTRQFHPENMIPAAALGDPFPIRSRTFSMDVTLRIKNSLIIRSYSKDPNMPDATHITSGNDPVLTGTSLKGAIRARAERIVNTLQKDPTILKRLFGHVDDKNRSKTATKGRIRVKEIILPRYFAELQNRIKIDRFTGGTVESALFDTMPLFPNLQDKALKVKVRIHTFKKHEAGLLLLVLKDLWAGDLAVGGEKNVGRGVFEGLSAIIEYDKEQIVLGNDLNALPVEHRDKLEAFVKALISEN